MATTTTNLGLKKPATTDYYNIQDFNDNADTLDTFAGNAITTDKLINNASATAAGFALDARMGKTQGDQINTINTNLAYKAPLASPNFSGTPTIATKSIATTEKVDLTLLNGWSNLDKTPCIAVLGQTVIVSIRTHNGTTTEGTVICSTGYGVYGGNTLFPVFDALGNSIGVVYVNSTGNIVVGGRMTSNTDVNINFSYIRQ